MKDYGNLFDKKAGAAGNDGALTRDGLQDKAVETFRRNGRLILAWGTGVGKSRVAIRCIRDSYREGARILLLVAETAHKKNWEDEFVAFLGEEGKALYGSICVECYASLKKYRHTGWDMIVADEAHHLRGAKRLGILSTIKASRVLMLSATLSDNGDGEKLTELIEKHFGKFDVLSCTVGQAIEEGILSRPKIIIHVLDLDDIKGEYVFVDEWGAKSRRKVIDCDAKDADRYRRTARPVAATLNIRCNARQAYGFYCDKVEEEKACWQKVLSESPADRDAALLYYNKMNLAGSRRSAFIGLLKDEFAGRLLRYLGDRRLVCFCSNVRQACSLGADEVIHAKRKPKDNMAAIERFNGGETNRIFAVNMIREGQNLAGIQAGVIIQLGSKEREFVQKFGRAMRGVCPQQHIIVIRGTKDEAWIRNVLGPDAEGKKNPLRKWVVVKGYGKAKNITAEELLDVVAAPTTEGDGTPRKVKMGLRPIVGEPVVFKTVGGKPYAATYGRCVGLRK